MKGGPNRRVPRHAGAPPSGRPTIEREKIRHRRPNDLAFDDDDEPPQRQYPDEPSYAEQSYHDVADEDWTASDQAYEDSSWDDDTSDDWALDNVELADDSAEFDRDGGVIWADEPTAPDDRIPGAFERDQDGDEFAPEVELAGRRDVRPRPPKPPPRQRAPHQSQRQHGRVRQAPPVLDDDVDYPQDLERDQGGFSHQPSEDRGRFARTRATINGEAAALETDAGEEVLRPKNRHAPSPSRRRQAHPTKKAPPGPLMRIPTRKERRFRKPLLILVLLALVGAGMWFAYQKWGLDGFGPMINRLTEVINLPGSERTAADTSFNDQLPPEEALAELSRATKQGNGQATATPPAALEIDPATVVKDGPPLPKFKPLDVGATRSISGRELTDLQAADGERTGEEGPSQSVFERIWNYLNPG